MRALRPNLQKTPNLRKNMDILPFFPSLHSLCLSLYPSNGDFQGELPLWPRMRSHYNSTVHSHWDAVVQCAFNTTAVNTAVSYLPPLLGNWGLACPNPLSPEQSRVHHIPPCGDWCAAWTEYQAPSVSINISPATFFSQRTNTNEFSPVCVILFILPLCSTLYSTQTFPAPSYSFD